MKKNTTINILVIIFSNLFFIALILISPFFFKWYEQQLGHKAEGVEELITIIGMLSWTATQFSQAVIIHNKINYNNAIKSRGEL